jgi:hypothetical protein
MEESISCKTKQILSHLWNPQVHYRAPFPSQINPVHTLTPSISLLSFISVQSLLSFCLIHCRLLSLLLLCYSWCIHYGFSHNYDSVLNRLKFRILSISDDEIPMLCVMLTFSRTKSTLRLREPTKQMKGFFSFSVNNASRLKLCLLSYLNNYVLSCTFYWF